MHRNTTILLSLLLTLAWLTGIHVISLQYFSDGYLKTKGHLPHQSSCSDIHTLYDLPDKSYLDDLGTNESCWSKPKFEQIVILLIDSLRFDFCVMDPNYTQGDTKQEGHAFIDPGDDVNIIRHYKNKMPIINQTLATKPDHSRLFRFEADPPTATMQRIKALTTGSMPTFMEVSDNFASEAIHDDNWVVQMGSVGRRAVFMGDDTWLSMYPTSFAKAFPYPSFEVRDLDTVDRGVQKHLIPEIEGESYPTCNSNGTSSCQKKTWDLILGHMLGVDHVGHRLGSNHPMMAIKLGEMNSVIETVMNAVRSDTLFVVMSDHGMNYEGNHGGSTSQETGASLLLYSPSPIFHNPVFKSLPAGQFASISQIDIVPTISMLLGAPIPFGSLGMIIPELFWSESHPEHLLDPLHVNTAQLLRYLRGLTDLDNRFPSEEMEKIQAMAKHAAKLHGDWQLSSHKSVEEAKVILEAYIATHKYAVDMCRRLWTTFDVPKMQIGLAMLGAVSGIPLILSLIHVPSISQSLLYVAIGVFWVPLTWAVGWRNINLPMSVDWMLFVAAVASLGLFYASMLREHESFFVNCKYSASIEKRAWNFSGFKFAVYRNLGSIIAAFSFIILMILRYARVTSNSFIINAHQTCVYLFSSLLMLLSYTAYRKGNSKAALQFLCCIPLTRITYSTFSGSHENYFPGSSATDLLIYTIIPGLSIFLIFVFVCQSVCRFNQVGSSIFITPLILLSIYWAAQYKGILDQLQEIRLYIPWTIYLFGVMHILLLISSAFTSRPIHTYFLEHTTELSNPEKLKLSLHSLFLALLPSILLVLGPASPLPMLLFLCTSLLTFSAFGHVYFGQKPARWPDLALLALMWSYYAHTYFYATSHLPVFTSLQMGAAFIGIDSFSLYLGGFLVGYNAFFAHFIAAATIPIVSITVTKVDIEAVVKSILLFSFITSSTLTGTCISSYMHMRHLFVWTVFAPYFIFDLLILLIVDVGLILGTLIAMGIAPNVEVEKKIHKFPTQYISR